MSVYDAKEPLIKSFLPFFATLSVTDFRAFLKTAKRYLCINQRIPNSAQHINSAESEIIGDYVFIPICYENEYLVSDGKSADLTYSSFTSTVWFGEAKYFD